MKKFSCKMLYNYKFHPEIVAMSDESRRSFKSVIPLFSAVFPLKFLHIVKTTEPLFRAFRAILYWNLYTENIIFNMQIVNKEEKEGSSLKHSSRNGLKRQILIDSIIVILSILLCSNMSLAYPQTPPEN